MNPTPAKPQKRDGRIGPVRFIMVGGFLGAGKTTTLLRLARHFRDQGLRVGIITNDQAEGLIDTLAFKEAGYTTEEISSGCFCCHFEKLLEASGRLEDGLEPDVILAEPVGSCTDLVNAVITPLKNLYRDRFEVAPYATLLDPSRAREALAASGPLGFSRKVTYLYKMQQHEADIVVVNKLDTLDSSTRDSLQRLVAQNFPSAPCIFVSALTGDGFESLITRLETGGESGTCPARVDYTRYTEGEIALGWLNARLQLEGGTPWDGEVLMKTLSDHLQAGWRATGVIIAHFKMRLIDGNGEEVALHLTRNDGLPALNGCFTTTMHRASLLINVRAEGSPEALEAGVRAALTESRRRFAIDWTEIAWDAFSPHPPSPPPPERNTVRIES